MDQAQSLKAPEMERLLNAFVGKWTVKETFEVSASRRGKTREETATFRAGPGFSLTEDYQSNGSGGELHFLALLWWDPKSHVYPLLTCANNSGCELRGTARWEGTFTLVSEGLDSGLPFGTSQPSTPGRIQNSR
jgi:hypothetical protein